MTERLLADIAITEKFWAEATIEALKEDWTTKEQAEFYGFALADAVVMGGMSIDNLRRLSIEMNALDKEAVTRSGHNMEDLADADYFEALARRIGNQATSEALKFVKSDHLRKVHLRGYMCRLGLSQGFGIDNSMPGMGRLERRSERR